MDMAHDIIRKAGISPKELAIASRRHSEASCQKLLLEKKTLSSTNNDFYIYRYLASQAFLPGYNFPAMPLLAWVPDESNAEERGTVLSRSRFLGLSEFGPRNVI